MDRITQKLEAIFQKNNFYQKEPMSKHTSFKIGGVADYFGRVTSEAELKSVLELVKQEQLPFFILGNGTNLLVRDGGIRGIVLKMAQTDYTIEKKEKFAWLTAKAGISLAQLAFVAWENGLTGLESMAGIPGTLGGAIHMNAGAYGKEMKDVVVSSKCMDENGTVQELSLSEHQFGYRTSAFQNNGLILLETTIQLEYGQKEEIKQTMEEYQKERRKKQPLEFPNAGSTFKRKGTILTAKLIEEAGLKGYSIGGAEVSTKHAGFIINKGKATAKDVLELVNHIQTVIKEKMQQEIELEMIVIGEEEKGE